MSTFEIGIDFLWDQRYVSLAFNNNSETTTEKNTKKLLCV